MRIGTDQVLACIVTVRPPTTIGPVDERARRGNCTR
jgi:hypothetical protein